MLYEGDVTPESEAKVVVAIKDLANRLSRFSHIIA
jgi:hypothetical protein